MKITNEGLKNLFLSREPSFDEALKAYLIYEWKEVKYYASLHRPDNLSENEIFIEISDEQFQLISGDEKTNSQSLQQEAADPKPHKTHEGTSNLSILSQITAKYSSALLLKYDQDKNSLSLEDLVGEIITKPGFQISLKHPSPFRVALQTLKPFHGNYSENEITNQNLIQCGINPQNLWITAHPILENKQLVGMLVGLSNNSLYDLSDLDIFSEVDFFARKVLINSVSSAA